MCQEPLDPDSGRCAENHSVKPSIKPSRSGRRCVSAFWDQLKIYCHCNEHSCTQRVPSSLLLKNSHHIYTVSRSSLISTQRNTLNIFFLSHSRAAKTSWDVCWRKPRSAMRQRSVRPTSRSAHTLLDQRLFPPHASSPCSRCDGPEEAGWMHRVSDQTPEEESRAPETSREDLPAAPEDRTRAQKHPAEDERCCLLFRTVFILVF